MITKYTQYIKESNTNSQFFKTYEETKKWLDLMKIKNYTINKDLTVDVNGWVVLSNQNLLDIPVQFGKINGDFDCSNNKLTSLKGSPIYVYDFFNCNNNLLSSLGNLPQEIYGNFSCSHNPLYSIDGLSIYNLKKNTNKFWYTRLSTKIKEDYFDKMLEENPEIFGLIDFETSKEFKTKWYHLFNASKFDLI